MRISLYQPDQPGNVGAILRLGACLGISVDIIEPCGFAFSHRALRRAGMDYMDAADVKRHESWASFTEKTAGRMVLLTTKGDRSLADFPFAADDCILLGSESSGVPEEVRRRVDVQLKIPQMPGTRSLNIAVAAGIAIAAALDRTGGWPE